MSKQQRTRNTRAVVTGGGSGIGRAFALELTRRDGQVVVADINPDAAAETVRLIEAAGGKGLAVTTDVTSEQSIRELAAAAIRWFGTPTLVVNNAGIGSGGTPIGQNPIPAWHKVIDVNLWSVVYGVEVFTPLLREAGRGGFINTASAAGFAVPPGSAGYNVSKAGVIALSETLASELYGTDIAVTVLCPTFVNTNIFKGELIDQSSVGAAVRLAERGLTADQVATFALDTHDRGRLYTLPQRDARLVWRYKRLAPARYLRTAARFAARAVTAPRA